MTWLTPDQLRHFHFGTDEPVLLSVSGGRTSGFMLWATLQAYGGALPENVHVVFFNTGKEFEETLRFVHDQAVRWGVRITWLEFDPTEPFNTSVVGYNSASRNGEPFTKVIQRQHCMPNSTMRLCTEQLKIKRGIAYMRDMLGISNWLNVVGLRHDEQRRVARQRARNEAGRERFETVMPLDAAMVTRQLVSAFWKTQAFNLALPDNNGRTPLGNCDLCFMKSRATLMGIMRLFPEKADWWIEQERTAPGLVKMDKPEMALFRAGRPSYAAMAQYVRDQGDIEDDGEESLPCGCHD
jgi:3'-phosphoadenosine 5'-phosphosulfate sulfotransferase (PAPS reductase)/FAD synthetase